MSPCTAGSGSKYEARYPKASYLANNTNFLPLLQRKLEQHDGGGPCSWPHLSVALGSDAPQQLGGVGPGEITAPSLIKPVPPRRLAELVVSQFH